MNNRVHLLIFLFFQVLNSAVGEFVPYSSNEIIEPTVMNPIFDSGRDYFLAPNERRPQEAAEILAHAPSGMLIAVGFSFSVLPLVCGCFTLVRECSMSFRCKYSSYW